MARNVVGTFVALALLTAALAGVGAVGVGDEQRPAATGLAASRAALAAQKRPIRFAASDLFIEINATDGDAGLQMNLDGEDWRRLRLRDPRGRTVMDVNGRGRLSGLGLTAMTFESSEPPFEQVPFRKFKARFPEGRYTFTGTTVDGRSLIGSDRLTHDVPQRPRLLAPAKDAVVDPTAGVGVSWERVTRPSGIKIVRYFVLVSEEGSDRELSMELRSTTTSTAIPPGFLARGAEYKLEVLAREKSGNQTITEVLFKTSE